MKAFNLSNLEKSMVSLFTSFVRQSIKQWQKHTWSSCGDVALDRREDEILCLVVGFGVLSAAPIEAARTKTCRGFMEQTYLETHSNTQKYTYQHIITHIYS